MSEGDLTGFRSPYPETPGSSTPGPTVEPAEGRGELWAFFWLSIASTTIIAVAGVVAWYFVR